MVDLTQGTFTPAYGRDYKSVAAVKADFDEGKDFVFQNYAGRTYCSKRDTKPGMTLKFRYKKLRYVTFITVD